MLVGPLNPSPASMDDQDWEIVTVKKSSAANAAKAAGTYTNTITGSRVRVSSTAASMRKLDSADAPTKRKELSPESKQLIIAARSSNSWTQVDLNKQCGFPANTIREIEAGRICPSPGQLQILSRVLKVSVKYA